MVGVKTSEVVIRTSKGETDMNHLRKILPLLPAVALALMLSPRAKADAWNQKVVLTFSGPVEIPGQVLSPGTYVFKLMDSPSDRNIVQVYNRHETHCYGTFQTVPDFHLRYAEKPLIFFGERAAGAPEAVRAWLYPGFQYGHQFIYPRSQAKALARANHQPVASLPDGEPVSTN